ncbi:MAG: F0F1 ATP synthase subunit B [Pelagibacteraceae bacterium]|nr:MAG: F0F1 ATP synthase subunit B [Pelagibacteraceae bacterium]
MIKKIFFQLIFFSFLMKEAFAVEKSGMPQLNTEFWISQIFWLTLTFGLLYGVLSKLILPKINTNLEKRKSKILENIEAAEKQREDSEAKLLVYNEIISKSKLDSKTILNQAREKALKDINIKKELLESQIDEEIKIVEKEIENLIESAPEKINIIASEISFQLIQKLTGTEVNNSSVSAIVDDLSRRGRDKYYGN